LLSVFEQRCQLFLRRRFGKNLTTGSVPDGPKISFKPSLRVTSVTLPNREFLNFRR